MVKAKHRKSTHSKQSHIKKHGKQGDISEFRSQLDALGLKIVEVTADGNCFFRSLADQLEGNEEEHGKYRRMVVQNILKNREMFEPFIEDEVPFDEYCQNMEKDGTWAGHMELQAASIVTHSNICIHRLMSPRWYIRNFDDSKARMIHLSYHDGEHYNSVRLKEDLCTGPAKPIIIKADADLSAKPHQATAIIAKSKGGPGSNYFHEESVKLVLAGSGCDNARLSEQVLRRVDGDVGAAVEILRLNEGLEGCLTESDEHHGPTANSHGATGNGSYENHDEELKVNSPEQERANSGERMHSNENQKLIEEKIPRNKPCPCGSKKKYKSCCGTAKAKSLTKIATSQTVDNGKTKKDRKPLKKGGITTAAKPHRPEAGSPDVGALCI